MLKRGNSNGKDEDLIAEARRKVKEHQAKMREFISQMNNQGKPYTWHRQGVRERVILGKATNIKQPVSELRQGMGAALSNDIERMQTRLAQTKSFTPEYSRKLKTSFMNEPLPKQELHFNKHKIEFEVFGVNTKDQYISAFDNHIRNPNLRYFTVLRYEKFSKLDEAMWYLVDVESGMVAEYNETRKTYWSFFRHKNPLNFIQKAHGGMLEAVWTGETWLFYKA